MGALPSSGRRGRLWALGPALLLSCATSNPKPLSPRELAQLHLSRNEPEKAIPLLEELHGQSPSDLAVARSLAEAYAKARRSEELIQRLSRPGAPDTAAVHYMLGLSHFARAADAQGPAVGELERAIALAPQEAELHHRLGVMLLESERYEAALPPLRRAVELQPQRLAFALPLAKAYQRHGEPARAVAELRRVVHGSPTPQEVATARTLMDQLADPFARLPKAARARLEEGLEWLQQRDVPQQAIVTFEELLQEYPDLAVAHALLGLAYQRIDDAGRAVDELRRATELAPEDGRNHLYLAQLYLSKQRPEPARTHLARAVELHPLLDEAYAQLGDLALERKELDAAKEHFRVLTHLLPQATPPRGKLALVLQLQGDFAGADLQLRRALETEPDSVDLKLRLGVVHYERYKAAARPEEKRAAAEEARRWLGEVLAAQPDNALASRALASLKSP